MIQFTDLIWHDIYVCPYKVTRETKLQSFQYKVLHRILACNKYLSDIRAKDSSECLYCDSAVDILDHFLVKCPPVAHFWRSVVKWMNIVAKLDTGMLDEHELILGVYRKVPKRDIINNILLRVRFYIYRQRLYHKCQLDILQWLREFKHCLLSEQYICNIERKQKKFEKWVTILNSI